MRVVVRHGGGVFAYEFEVALSLQPCACAFWIWDGGSDAVWVLCGVGFWWFGVCGCDACSVIGQYRVRLVASGRSSCQRCVDPVHSCESTTRCRVRPLNFCPYHTRVLIFAVDSILIIVHCKVLRRVLARLHPCLYNQRVAGFGESPVPRRLLDNFSVCFARV